MDFNHIYKIPTEQHTDHILLNNWGIQSGQVDTLYWPLKMEIFPMYFHKLQKNWCFWTVVLENTLESPLDYKENQSVNPKENQSWIFRKDWCWSWNSNTLATWWEELTHWKRPWCWERLKAENKGTTEDVIVGWHHWVDGHDFE